MKRVILGFWALPVMVLPAYGAAVAICTDDIARASAIAEPWEQNTRSFSNGAIRVAVLDTFEPACCSFHLLVLNPVAGAEGERACHVVSNTQEGGFSGIDMAGIVSSYDPKKGLLLNLPVKINDQTKADGSSTPGIVNVRVNSATGQVVLEN